MVESATRMGGSAGGARNISGANHPLVELERELADLHGKDASLVFTSGYVSNHTGIATIASLLPNCVILSDATSWRARVALSMAPGCRGFRFVSICDSLAVFATAIDLAWATHHDQATAILGGYRVQEADLMSTSSVIYSSDRHSLGMRGSK